MALIVPQHTPTWKQGYASCAAESRNPGLWKGLVFAGLPSLGPTGLTLRDISGWKNHGTGITAFPDWVLTHHHGYALRYTAASNNAITCGAGKLLTNNENQFSVVLRVRRATNTYAGLLAKDTNPTRNWFFATYYNLQLRVRLYQTDSTSREKYTASNTLPLNTWTHLALVVDGPAGAVTLYIDGVPEDFTPLSWDGTVKNDASSPFTIGQLYSSAYDFSGDIY